MNTGKLSGTPPRMPGEDAKDAALRQLTTASEAMLSALADQLCGDARRAGATEQEIWDAITR